MRGMGFVSTAQAALGATLLGISTTLFAAAGTISTTVTPLSTNVTYSSTATAIAPVLDTVIGYHVTLTNGSSNTINSVVFEGTITVTDPQEIAAYRSADGATCSTVKPAGSDPKNSVRIRCSLGQFASGAGSSFTLYFTAPVKDVVSPTADGSDYVNFSGQAITAEGFNGGKSQNNSRDPWGPATPVLLGTFNPNEVKSVVPTSGATFFTGMGGISTAADQIATTVIVPPIPQATTATILESTRSSNGNGLGCGSNNFLNCNSSEITIPGTFAPYLTIILRQDAANIRSGTSINSVILRYRYLDSDNNMQTYIVGLCASPTTPLGNGLPCIAKQKYYADSSVPGWTPDLAGDFEWTVLNTKNGIMEFE